MGGVRELPAVPVMVVPAASPVADSTSPLGSVTVKVTGTAEVPRPAPRAGDRDTEYCPLLRPRTVMVVEGEAEA